MAGPEYVTATHVFYFGKWRTTAEVAAQSCALGRVLYPIEGLNDACALGRALNPIEVLNDEGEKE